MNEIPFEKRIALLEEFETSHKLLRLGFGELQNINMGNDFYFLPFQLLSQGFERLFKAYICVGYYHYNTELPNFKILKNLGHDLIALFDEIKDKYFVKHKPPIFEEDWDFISNNSLVREIIDILSDFGKQARYYNFNLITSNPKLGKNPKERWESLESRIKPLDAKQISLLLNPDTADEFFPGINRVIIATCERLLICLARQIAFGSLGILGKQLTSNSLFNYATLKEDDIGVEDYRKGTTTYNQTYKIKHKRSLVDYLSRRFNPNYKHKYINKKHYKGDWPFYVDEIVVEQRWKHWCVITIKGYDYALNGVAKGRYNLPTPHEGGMAIPGKSIEDFIQIALKL